jgi:hypothetical protein
MSDADRVRLPSVQLSTTDPVTVLVTRRLKVPVMASGVWTLVAHEVIVIAPAPAIAVPDKETCPFEEIVPFTGPVYW